MFFEDPKAVLLLKSNSLDIYSSDNRLPKEILFLSEAVSHLEIVSKAKLTSLLTDIVKGFKPQKAILLLANEVMFQKQLNISESSSTDIQKEEFFDKMPFKPDEIARKEIQNDETLYLFSTNKVLYKTIVEVFVSLGWSIDIVAPISIFPSVENKLDLSSEEISEILSSDDVLKKANFIEGEEFIVEQSADEGSASDSLDQSVWYSKNLVTGLVISVVLAGLGFGAYQFRQRFNNDFNIQKVVTEPVASPDFVASVSAKPATAYTSKESLKLRILNGSGVAGEAGKIKAKLTTLGYQRIETGNSPFDNKPEAIATYSAVVAPKEVDQIKKFLESNFNTVLNYESTDSAKFDITIITGIKVK